MDPARLDARELAGSTFACLEGCGFCCTFQPEVSRLELGRLRKVRPSVAVTTDGDRTYLALQNKCGACTLLERRACQAYDLRPAHCRYFPFHVHFARAPEAYVNYTCRGVERAAGGDLALAFRGSVLENVKDDEWAAHERAARETYAEFERRAQRAQVWGDVQPVLDEALPNAARLVTRYGLVAAAAQAGETLDVQALHERAMEPFGEQDPAKRPFYLAPDLKWLTFHRAKDALIVMEMDEAGRLDVQDRLRGFASWRDPSPGALQGIGEYVQRLAKRGSFEGSVFAIVDESDYTLTVEQATWARLVEIGADLAVRLVLLEALGTPPERCAAEAERFYDSTFFDAPTIGGWL